MSDEAKTPESPAKAATPPVVEKPEDQEFAVQIISKIEHKTDAGVTTQLVLHEQELQKILDRCAAISPKISILAVVGAFRTGKSFLLDLMLRYLRHYDAYPDQQPAAGAAASPSAAGADNEPQLPAWLLSAGEVLEAFNPPARNPEAEAAEAAAQAGSDPNAALLVPNGFAWRPDIQRTTTGIWMYGRPFRRVLPSGEVVAVLLMDTQGMFDMQSSQQGTASVFGLSTLISSYQVYNIQNRLQEDNIQHLNFFTDYARAAAAQYDQAQERRKQAVSRSLNRQSSIGKLRRSDTARIRTEAMMAADKEAEEAQAKAESERATQLTALVNAPAPHPFQTVEFLIRDWNYFDDVDDFDACIASMQPVLDKALDTSMQDSSGQAAREAINRAFEKVRIFMLPDPGNKMKQKKFTGKLTEIDAPFLFMVDRYMANLLNNLKPKRVEGMEVTPQQLFKYVQAIISVFTDDKLPKVPNLANAIGQVHNTLGSDAAIAMYQSEMKKKLVEALSPDALDQLHQSVRESALLSYDAHATFGDESLILEVKRALETKIDAEYERFKKDNDERTKKSLDWLVHVFIAMVAMYVIDRVTDFTCDSWSDTCVRISQGMSFGGWCAFVVILYHLVIIYRTHGSTVATMNLFSLATDSLEVISKYQEKAKKIWAEKMGGSTGSAVAAAKKDD